MAAIALCWCSIGSASADGAFHVYDDPVAFSPTSTTLVANVAVASAAGTAPSAVTAGVLGFTHGRLVATEDAESGSVFWSGSSEARAAAEKFATDSGRQTLEMTARGQELGAANLEWTDAQPLWDAASADSAAGATGDVHVFQAAEGVRLGSTWARVEYQILSQNPDVNLIFHTVGGR
jgi:hypothetical protein